MISIAPMLSSWNQVGVFGSQCIDLQLVHFVSVPPNCFLSSIVTGAIFDDGRTMSTSEFLSMADSDQASLYSVSTNATDDNLPGAGRTLGLLYSFAGQHLEMQLGRLAERLGRGPRATALRIQKNSGIVTSTSVLSPPLSMVKFRTKKIEKDCKLLLKYVGSNALSTRGQALDRIIDLSLDDDYVRDLLKFMGAAHLIELAHKELFVRSDYDVSLLSRSRKALVSVTDDMLMQELRDVKRKKLLTYFKPASNVWTYVRDPERSFIVVRWVVRVGWPLYNTPSMPILDYLNVVLDTSPEWESVDQLFDSLLGFFKGKSMDILHRIRRILEMIIRSISCALSPSR
ncbi:hypothetical protein DFH11DRAFT_1219467 [Phellopilus nigrolimitatus]|nr:hypothetical protein DFH11DRAFT_1219467 [Phellopilus nigrolimitatus]